MVEQDHAAEAGLERGDDRVIRADHAAPEADMNIRAILRRRMAGSGGGLGESSTGDEDGDAAGVALVVGMVGVTDGFDGAHAASETAMPAPPRPIRKRRRGMPGSSVTSGSVVEVVRTRGARLRRLSGRGAVW